MSLDEALTIEEFLIRNAKFVTKIILI